MAASTWTNVGFVAVNELQGVVFELLAKFGFEFMRAPYGSLGQVCAMS